MLSWCLLDFSQQPFMVVPCLAVPLPHPKPAFWIMDIVFGIPRWTWGCLRPGVQFEVQCWGGVDLSFVFCVPLPEQGKAA